MDWIHIAAQTDIDRLQREYGGFHDACIRAIQYESGAMVDEKGFMHGISRDCALIMKFDRQIPYHETPKGHAALELRFIGLRRINLIGYQDHYFCDIPCCNLFFYHNYIVWAENGCIGPDREYGHCLITEPMYSFVIADHLAWRYEEADPRFAAD